MKWKCFLFIVVLLSFGLYNVVFARSYTIPQRPIYFPSKNGSYITFNTNILPLVLTTLYRDTDTRWYFDNTWITTTTDLTIDVFHSSNWLNYSVSSSGTQQVYYATKPNTVYIDSIIKGEADGWTWSSGTTTITEATNDVNIYYGTVTFTLGEFAADATVYANNYTFVNATVHTGNSANINSFVNVTVELSNNIVLKWLNATNTFSIASDPNNYCTLDDAISTKTSVNSTAFKLSWRIKLNWTYPEGSKSIVATNTKAYDVNSYASNSKTDLFTFEDDLIVYSASVDDSHVDPSQSITFSGTLYHQGTTSPPEDTNGITAKVLLVDTGQVKGSTTSIEASGDFTINILAPSTTANYTYRLYAMTDQRTVQNQTLYVVVDRLIIQLNANATYLDLDGTVGSSITAIYAYTSQAVTSWTINILRNETHFATGNFTDSHSAPCKNTYTVENVSETVYDLTAYASNVLTVYWGNDFVETDNVTVNGVEADEILLEKDRVNVGVPFYILYHVRWGANKTDCYPCILTINGIEVSTNSTGWVKFETTLLDVGKTTFVVTGVNASAETDYGQLPPDPEITADKLYVTFAASNKSPVKGDTVTISWEIKRLFDSTIVTDFVIDIAANGELRWIDLTANSVNDMTTQPLTRTYDVYVDSVTDNTYGLIVYDSKSVTVIWHEKPPPPPPPPVPFDYLLGVMVRTTLGDPVADLTIEIYFGDHLVTSGTTDPEGTYTAILPPNIYNVVVVLNGETVTETVELYDNKSVEITVPSAPTVAIGQFIVVVLVMIILIVGLALVPRALKRIKI